MSCSIPDQRLATWIEHDTARDFLRQLRQLVGSDGGLLIGVDLHKSRERLEAAYNDDAGVTARFNRNVLRHINQRADADFDPDAFEHRAFYDEERQRIEMHLVSKRAQTITCAGAQIEFAAGESLHTENSYKYSVDSFTALANDAGFKLVSSWLDEERLFSVHYLAART